MSSDERTLRLLLVDDEEDFLTSSSRALIRRGFDVDVAPNGVSALEMIESQFYDIVVLDVKMPDIDGIDVFRQLKLKQPELPVLLLTGHGSIDDAFYSSKEGVADYVSKPIDMDDLAARIRDAADRAYEKRGTASQIKMEKPPTVTVRVMLVDDETEFLDSMKNVLRRRHMDITTAESGRSALEMLDKSLVDVMVLDVKMPGMDGLEVLKGIRKRFPSVQVILLSGHPLVEAAISGIRMGASEYLRKPPDVDALCETIHRLYRERQQSIEDQQQRMIEEIRRRYPD